MQVIFEDPLNKAKLFIGGEESASDETLLTENNVKAIVQVAGNTVPPFEDKFSYKVIDADSQPDPDQTNLIQ